MEMRIFGCTGLELSVLGFGCGAVGGLMVRGDPLDQEPEIHGGALGRPSLHYKRNLPRISLI
jgi:aryl-alcohol dehydrogenase-like predicted oxidoreductase